MPLGGPSGQAAEALIIPWCSFLPLKVFLLHNQRKLRYYLITEYCIIEKTFFMDNNSHLLLIEEFGFGRKTKESVIY